MKIFTDNQADAGTVSGTDATVNYPASNVQDSRLSRIYRGGEQVDFDISGSGALQNISQAYTNLIQDPTDLTTGNWTEGGVTATISTESINGNLFTSCLSDGLSSSEFITQVIANSNTESSTSVIMRNIDSQRSLVFLSHSIDGDIGRYEFDWDTKSVVSDTADTIVKWVDNDTVYININTSLYTAAGNINIYLYPNRFAIAASVLITAVQLVSNTTTRFPFIDGSKVKDEITETYTMGSRFIIDSVLAPFYAYNTSIFHRILEWRIDSTHAFRIYYLTSADTYILEWEDNGVSSVTLTSQRFDDGTTYTNLNQRLRFTFFLDLVSGDINGSKLICTPLDSGSLFEDDAWSSTPAIKASDFPTIYIGADSAGNNQADAEFEYIKIYGWDGLKPTITTDSDITEYLEPKKILLDNTYQQKLTATDLLIANSTINDGDTITLRGNDVDSYGSGTPLDETVTWSKDITTHTFTKGSYQFWRLSVNSSNIIDMGRIYLGEAITPPGISPTLTHDKISTSVKSTSSSGQSYLDIRYKYVSVNTTFPAVTHAQKAIIFSIMDDIDIGTPFFVTFDEAEIDLNTLYVTLGSDTLRATLLQNPDYYTIGLTLTEEV